MTTPSRSGPRPERASAGELAGWLAALLAVAVLLPLTGYESRDPDSRLYAALAATMATQPVDRWIAPEWWGQWGRQDPFLEHPAGLFVLPALLASLGYPALQAAYTVNAAYQVLTLVLVQRLAACYAPGLAARSLPWMLPLLPIAFVYRIRANHEQAMALGLVLALYATVRSRSDARWMAVTAAAFVFMATVKGLLAVFAPLACAWVLLVGRWTAPRGTAAERRAWAGLALAVLATAVAAGLYEAAYRLATGESFHARYVGRWISVALRPAVGPRVAQTADSVLWYLVRLVLFALPWSLVAGWALWSVRRDLARIGAGPAPDEAGRAHRLALGGLLAGLGVVAIYLGLMSLPGRRADRYLFPAYIVLGATGAGAAARSSPPVQRLTAAADRWHPYTAVVIYLAGFGLSLGWNLLELPRGD